MRMTTIAGLLLPAALVACAATGLPEETQTIDVALPVGDAIARLNTQAMRCWSKAANPLEFGIAVVPERHPDNHAELHVLRKQWSDGSGKAFMHISIHPAGAGARVRVTEGDFACGFNTCQRLGLSAHLGAWLAGDEACKAFSRR